MPKDAATFRDTVTYGEVEVSYACHRIVNPALVHFGHSFIEDFTARGVHATMRVKFTLLSYLVCEFTVEPGGRSSASTGVRELPGLPDLAFSRLHFLYGAQSEPVEVWIDGRSVGASREKATIVASRCWHSPPGCEDVLAGFVPPNCQKVEELVAKLPSEVVANQVAPTDPEQVLKILEGTYNIVSRQVSAYAYDGCATYEAHQAVRTPDRLLDLRTDTCIDLAILLAACIESLRLNPLVLLVGDDDARGNPVTQHALIGVWKLPLARFARPVLESWDQPYELASAMESDGRILRRVSLGELVAGGLLIPVECTGLCHLLSGDRQVQGKPVSLEISRTVAMREHLPPYRKLRYAIDVQAARAAGRHPLPWLPSQVGDFRPRIGTSSKDGAKMVFAQNAGLYVDKYPVTVEQYERYVGKRAVWDNPWKALGAMPDRPTLRLPATNVSAREAAGFAKWAGKRLPTPEEWRLIAVAGHQEPYPSYPWGNEFSAGRCNVAESRRGGPTPVETYDLGHPQDHEGSGCNPAGVCDVAGNVMEWCTRDGRYFACGGSFDLPKEWARVCEGNVFGGMEGTHRNPEIGFRCVVPPRAIGADFWQRSE